MEKKREISLLKTGLPDSQDIGLDSHEANSCRLLLIPWKTPSPVTSRTKSPILQLYAWKEFEDTVCLRSLGQIYIVSYYIKWI